MSVGTAEIGINEYNHFIGGRWVEAAGGELFDDLDPYTGAVVARVNGR